MLDKRQKDLFPYVNTIYLLITLNFVIMSFIEINRIQKTYNNMLGIFKLKSDTVQYLISLDKEKNGKKEG